MTIAPFVSRWESVRRIMALPLILKSVAVLLSNITGVLPSSVWVTETCRCLLLDSPELPLLTTALQFRGTWSINLL